MAKENGRQMNTESVCWSLFALFAIISLMADAITVVPELETRRGIAELISVTATVIFGVGAITSRQTALWIPINS